MNKTTSRLATALLIGLGLMLGGTARAEDAQGPVTFVAAGSGVNLGITQMLAKAFTQKNPSVQIKVPGSIGTKGAITAIADHAITFGLISRPLKDSEKNDAISVLPYAKTPFVIAVHPTVKNNEITYEEIVEIFRGNITKWDDGKEIVVLTREPFDSGIQLVEKEIPNFKDAYAESQNAKRWIVHFTDQEANHALASTPFAVGFTDLGMITTENLNIKPLILNGAMPSPQNLTLGKYPLSRSLYILYHDKELPEKARDFLKFIQSEEGSKILRSYGYVPLN